MKSYVNEPLEIHLNAPNGCYEVCVNIKAHCDTVFTLYAQHRNVIRRDVEIKAGEEKDFTFAVSVFDRHFHGGSYEKADGIKIQIATDGNVTATATATPKSEIRTVFICGDSTVTDQPAEYPYDPVSTYCGWGQAFPSLVKPTLAVANHAQSGSCTTEFMETNLKAFEDIIKPEDIVVIEFGHNDQKHVELDAFGGYKNNLLKLAAMAREKGAYPVICSPINRIIFEPDGSLRNLLGEYRNAAKAAAEEADCAFIDMWQRSTEFFVKAGPVKSWQFFRSDATSRDYTHTNDKGGELVAKFFASQMLETNGPLAKYIESDRVVIEEIIADPGDKDDNSDVLRMLSNVNLVNVPEDFDADITGLQI